MTHKPVVVSPLAHANFHSESDSVPVNRRALRAGTAIASAIRGAFAFAPAQAFVAPPEGGLPFGTRQGAKRPLMLAERVRRLFRPGPDPNLHPPPVSPVRLMPSDAGRHFNAMPGHAMAAGGRPLILKIPGR